MSDGSAQTVRSFLARASLFQNISARELDVIVAAAQRKKIRRAEFFFQQGDTAAALYILDAGQVRLTQLAPEGNQVILRFIRAGEMFGGLAALGVATYPVSAQALEDSAAWVWDAATMRALMLRFPPLALNALEHTAEVIMQLQDRVRELQTERVERRVARALLRLARQCGKRVDAGVLIDMALSRQDLAELTGTNLYSVSRILRAWEKQGFVEAGRARVVLRAPHQLVIIADDLTLPETPTAVAK
jgi:CRP-like cAMP-binding protein